MLQLQNNILDKPYWKNTVKYYTEQTSNPDRTLPIRITGGFPKGQKHDTTNLNTKTDRGKSMAEKPWRKNTIIYNGFIDFSKAFDTINQELIWAVLDSYGVDKKVFLINAATNIQAVQSSCEGWAGVG